MLTSRITAPPPTNPEPEDIFSSSLNALFTDDTQDSHGIPGGIIIYHSPNFGPLTLRIPSHPDVDEGRHLFAHYLWNAAVVAADLIEAASAPSNPSADRDSDPDSSAESAFNTTRKTTLELGAGTGLPSLICALCNASTVVITDHPNSPSITADTITSNVHRNLFPPDGKAARSRAKVQVRGYAWDEASFTSPSPSPSAYGVPLQPAAAAAGGSSSNRESFDRILLCDCLWLASQHGNLIASICAFLSRAPGSCAIVVAGFHTGRGIVGDFFARAAGGDVDGRGSRGPLEMADIYEVDVDGVRRDWERERQGETRDQAKRWCVVGVLKRRQES